LHKTYGIRYSKKINLTERKAFNKTKTIIAATFLFLQFHNATIIGCCTKKTTATEEHPITPLRKKSKKQAKATKKKQTLIEKFIKKIRKKKN